MFMVDFKELNKVSKWRLYVYEQKKTENAVIMNCAMSGRKKEDGTFDKSLNIRVVVGSKTNWPRVDFTGKTILADGGFQHKWWEKDGKTGIDLTVFADSIVEYVREEPKPDDDVPAGWSD